MELKKLNMLYLAFTNTSIFLRAKRLDLPNNIYRNIMTSLLGGHVIINNAIATKAKATIKRHQSRANFAQQS